MKLNKVLKAANHRVAGGSEYGWGCFGPDARWMEFSDRNEQEFADCVYDIKTNRVYQINVHVPGNSDDRCVTWIDPEFDHAYAEESKRRKISPYQAWDNVMYTTIPGSEENMILDLLNDAAAGVYDNFPAAKYVENTTGDRTVFTEHVGDDVDDDVDVSFHKLDDVQVKAPVRKKQFVARFTVEYTITVDAEDLIDAYDQSLAAVQTIDPNNSVWVNLVEVTKESIQQL